MGCAGTKDAQEGGFQITQSDDDRKLNEQLEAQQKEENAIVKLLVLGTGESGKSTVFKQMKQLYSVPDPPSKFIMVVRANLFGNAQTVHQGMQKLSIAYQSDEGKAAGELIASKPADGNLEPDDDLMKAFKSMYVDKGVEEAIDRAAEYQLNDSTRYFWERSDEILKSDYMPSAQDVLRARVRTTGIVQQNFQIKDKKYTMFDVGGQRNERRKWIHCFDNVTAVIFVTAISEYDQVLYEDENTNRMDEALLLFDQICNHPSFAKTSMILFLNKRDLFADKLKKKDMTAWTSEAAACGQDYDKCITFIKAHFLEKNKDPLNRQVYCHATCATDTSNVAFVMDSVFDVILKENLRKMEKVDISSLIVESTGGSAAAKKVPSYAPNTVALCFCAYAETLKERKVLVCKDDVGKLPAVELGPGPIKEDSPEWMWCMSLGKDIPQFGETPKAEMGTFNGNFKDAVKLLREMMGTKDLGFVYDKPIFQEKTKTTLIVCVSRLPDSGSASFPAAFCFKEFEEFENPHYKFFAGVDTDASPCKPPPKGEEFNPFAANPVGFRWFKGVGLYTEKALALPDKGVYLGMLKVSSIPGGFQIMVNEHDRIMIPMIFITCTQLTEDELSWFHGVRIREMKGIDLLEGKKPNRGWLGPEMSGEEGATFPEKLWWAIDEGRARLGGGQDQVSLEKFGKLYDKTPIFVDEGNNIQLICYASIGESSDILPGHIWMSRPALETQNMKYLCPSVISNIMLEQTSLLDKYVAINTNEGASMEKVREMRNEKDALKVKIEDLLKASGPLKWINKIILWCADKMPSIGDAVDGCEKMDAPSLISAALALSKPLTVAEATARASLITKYKK